jgi:hypothetical protein
MPWFGLRFLRKPATGAGNTSAFSYQIDSRHHSYRVAVFTYLYGSFNAG